MVTEDIRKTERKIEQIIDELKGICNQNGLSNTPEEETIITNVFLYKFLNDKFMYSLKEFAKKENIALEDLKANKEGILEDYYYLHRTDVTFGIEDTLGELAAHLNDEDIDKQFDEVLERISNNPDNKIFSIKTADGTLKPLFERVSKLGDVSDRKNFIKNILAVLTSEAFDFSGVFVGNFDFYSTIFEYLIKDYNVASGVYAEYFTPQAVSKIISEILVDEKEDRGSLEIYDPSAGSGSLVLHLADRIGYKDGKPKSMVYTQDISNKSTRFLRINLLLNGLSSSLNNVVQGDTLLNPAHWEDKAHTGLKKFDYITSNPPFKVDFSSTRDTIESAWSGTDRFFAGVPKVPNKKKESMAIYAMFIQHILHSLKEDGKAAIVLPTGFITAQSGIEKKIREKLIEDKMLRGIISMPSNIFANTGTNVSIIFIDKANKDGNIVLMDASKLGKKVKEGKAQRTVLSEDEKDLIIDTFNDKKEVEDLSVVVSYEDIKSKNYSFSAGQYFEVKVEFVELTEDEFEDKVGEIKGRLSDYFKESKSLEEEIVKQLEGLKYE